jgi:uncharacterized protein DUF6174
MTDGIMTRMKGTTLRTLLLGLALAAAGCVNPMSPTEEALDDARDKWEDQGIDSYRITVRESCFCPIELGGPFVVTVVRGRIESVVYAGEGADVVPNERIPLTVDELFDTVETADREAAEVRAEYDPTYGFPATIFVDRIRNAVDDEVYYEARDFQVIR